MADSSRDISRRGGASTLAGVSYQIRLAVLRALVMVERQLAAPHLDLSITVEHVHVSEAVVEKWDIAEGGAGLDERIVEEAKTVPRPNDVFEFAAAVAKSDAVRFRLTFEDSRSHVSPLRYLVETIRAACSDEAQFQRMLDEIEVKKRKVVQLAEAFGHEAFDRLARVDLDHISTNDALDRIRRIAVALAGDDAERVISFLRDHFLDEGGRRRPQPIAALIAHLRAAGIALTAPNVSATPDIAAPARAALYLLDMARAPLPISAVVAASGVTEARLRETLDPLVGQVVDLRTNELALAMEFVAPIRDPRGPKLAADALRELLAEWRRRERNHDAVPGHYIDAAIRLGELAREVEPEVVACVFRTIEKPLKARGDKQAVLSAALLSIDAANGIAQPEDDVLENLAIALICGRSWVYQRVGELAMASRDAEQALKIAQTFEFAVTEAFCLKCTGRLYRLEAEASKANKKKRSLRLSADHLRAAIERFEALEERGEVGDSYSLLARTHLVAGDVDAALDTARQAQLLLDNPFDKDYLDLGILLGDIRFAMGELAAAALHYSTVIETEVHDRDRSEIRARALLRRGLANERACETAAAVSDFEEADSVYTMLGELERAAEAKLAAMKLSGTFPSDPAVAQMLAEERPAVQVRAIDNYAKLRAQQQSGRTLIAARRNAEERAGWMEIIKSARRESEREAKHW